MILNSFSYIFFLFIISIIYYAIPHKFRWFLLLISGIIFFLLASPQLIYIPIAIILISYYTGILLNKYQKKKLIFSIGIISLIGILFFYKYFNFFNDSITYLLKYLGYNNSISNISILVPLGISYITFQAIGYLIEIYQNNQLPEKKLSILATYFMFFPKLTAGPVERAHNFLPQLYEKHKFDYQSVTDGFKLLIWGLFKKLVIADRLAIITNSVYDNIEYYPSVTLISATIFFTIQLYADFSGYTDIARGSAQILGFKMMENFNLPFIAKSSTELWRRWHISLSSWFNEYFFTPLSISVRNWGTWGLIFASMATFLTLGLWHGSSWGFVIFGGIQGVMLSIELVTKKLRKKARTKLPKFINDTLGITFTFAFFSFALIFFRANTVSDAIYVITNLFTNFPTTYIDLILQLPFSQDIVTKAEFAITLIVIIIIILEHYFFNKFKITNILKRKNLYFRLVIYTIVILAIIFFGVFNMSQFIYFKF